MDHYLLIARTITQAQRMVQVLNAGGIRVQIFRAPAGLTDRGCSYAVRIPGEQLNQVLQRLEAASLQPVSVFQHGADGYKKVVR